MKSTSICKFRYISLLIGFFLSLTLYAQSASDWQYLGKVAAYYGQPDGYEHTKEPAVCAQLYSHFDGEHIQYKIIVGQDVIQAIPNPEYNQEEYEAYMHTSYMNRKPFQNRRFYPYIAAKYRFNPTDAILQSK